MRNDRQDDRRARFRSPAVVAGSGLLTLVALISAPIGATASEACVPVKAWEKLDDPVRLCAYLTDQEEAAACEARGFRLGGDVDADDAQIALQYLLLCANEFVIAVERDGRGDGPVDRLAVTTASVEDGDGASGYYDRGRVRILVRESGIWSEEGAMDWEE